MNKSKFLYYPFIILLTMIFSISYADINQKISSKLNDAVIVTKIKSMYAVNKELNPFKIKVTSKQGNVKLSGKVDTDKEYEKAVMIAESVDGVKDVDAKLLKVKKSEQPLKDVYITAKIKGLLIKNKIMNSNDVVFWTIDIETKNGVVHLSGKVNNAKEKTNIINIVKSVKGVKSVDTAGLTVISKKQKGDKNE